MTFTELKSPIRLYWDLSPHRSLSLDYREICRQITACRFLTLELTAMAPQPDALCGEVLTALARAPLAVSLTVTAASPDSLAALAPFPANLKQLLLRFTALEELRAALFPPGNELSGVPVGVSFPVTGESASHLPEVVSFCIEREIRRLVLPMQRLGSGEEPFSLTKAQRADLAGRLGSIGRLETLAIVIHDPFLWRAFFPERQFPEGRCQAANTMLYLASDATVYPCPTMPVPLGNLTEESLVAIVGGKRKDEVRSAIRELPALCRCCPETAVCGGGCRGRGYAAGQSWDAPDYGCR